MPTILGQHPEVVVLRTSRGEHVGPPRKVPEQRPTEERTTERREMRPTGLAGLAMPCS